MTKYPKIKAVADELRNASPEDYEQILTDELGALLESANSIVKTILSDEFYDIAEFANSDEYYDFVRALASFDV